MSKVGIILINYKEYASRFLIDARDSLRTQSYPKECYKVYIVDNATTYETETQLHELYPEAIIIPTSGNGWGHANNIGMQRAFADGCSGVALVNMDTIFDTHWLAELVAVGSTHNVGVAQSKILLYPPKDGVYRINSNGNVYHYLGFGFCRDYGKLVSDDTARTVQDIGYASGASLYIRREVAEKVGMCDAHYFMYHDDMELSFKTKLLGLRVVLAPRSLVFHKYEFSRSIRQLYYMERNRYIFLLTFFQLRTLLLIMPAVFFMEAGIGVFATLHGWGGVKLRAYLFFLMPSTWRQLIASRKKLRTLRMVSDAQLLNGAASAITFQEIDNVCMRRLVNPLLHAYWNVIKKWI